MIITWTRTNNDKTQRYVAIIDIQRIKALIALVGRLSLIVGWENGPEHGLKTASFNPKLHVIEANSTDPDQTPRSAASDLGLHSLPMSQMSRSRFYRYPSTNSTLMSQQQECRGYK